MTRLTWLALLALAACATSTKELDALKTLQEDGKWEAIAARAAPCTDRADACSQAQEIRADACLRLARQRATDPAAPGWRDCAMRGFAAAAAAQPAGADRGRTRQLLANEATAAMDQRDATGRGAEEQLRAGTALLTLDPRDPRGCYHVASARLARSLLLPEGPGRCAELAVPGSCAGVGLPAEFGGRRSPAEAVQQQRQRLACP